MGVDRDKSGQIRFFGLSGATSGFGLQIESVPTSSGRLASMTLPPTCLSCLTNVQRLSPRHHDQVMSCLSFLSLSSPAASLHFLALALSWACKLFTICINCHFLGLGLVNKLFHITWWPWKPVQLDGHLVWLHIDTCGFLNNYACTCIWNWQNSSNSEYQNVINQSVRPIALVSMVTTLCETRLSDYQLQLQQFKTELTRTIKQTRSCRALLRQWRNGS